MEGADSTFALTEAKAGDGARPTSAGGTVVEDPRGMSMVHEQYGKLNEVVKNLNEKTKGLLMKERSEFLAAYRANGNFTTWVVETSAAEVYMPEWWSTPSMSNCTFARFLPHVAARDDDFHSSPP